MNKPIRQPRKVTEKRLHHGFYVNEFVPYADDDGRADPATCPHHVFLDHHDPITHICLECGSEFMMDVEHGPVTLKPGDTILINSRIRPDTLLVEGVHLPDDELTMQRHRWHAIWGMDGWTGTGPHREDLVPPARLKGKLSKIPDMTPNKSVVVPHLGS